MALVLPLALGIAVAAAVGLLVVHREALRRVVLGTIDPRPLALFRIALGLCLLSYVVEIAPLSTYLWSDEGLMPSAAVSQTYGRGALAGYGDGVRDPAGFLGIGDAIRHAAHGRWSLLYFWDDPALVDGYLVVLTLACVGVVIGWRTRGCTVVAWLLLTGLLRRGDAHWGGEQVFTGLLFPMLFARSGAAFGVDAWRRNRALARRGRLDPSEGGQGAAPSPEHPHGLAAIYPRVPAWPQVLLVAQLALCYVVNGWTKAGPTWVSGETLRMAVHLDRYARLDWHGLALALGPWPFRLATWSVLWWERLFPLVVVGLWMRAVTRAKAPPLTGRARWGPRLCWLTLAGALMVWALVPGALAKHAAVAEARAWALGTGASVVIVAVVLGPRLGARARPWILRLLDPRGWLGFGVVFHATSLVLFEIGSFASATISAYLLCGLGPTAVAVVQRVMRALGRRGVPVPEHLRRAQPLAAEDPSLPHLHRDGAALSSGALAGAGALVLLGLVLGLVPATGGSAWWHGAWVVAGFGLVVVGWRAARRATPGAVGHGASTQVPLAHGPAGRLAAGGLVAYHLVALLAWQVPAMPSVPWRGSLRALVNPWMELTFTRHLWSMFAPNGPRSNMGLRTVVVDEAGDVHDLRTELQHPENLPRPYLRHDRWHKVHEAVGGYRPWLARWHARYVCRRWAFDHDGEPPSKVRLSRVAAPFPPMEPVDVDRWFWSHAKVVPIVEVECAQEPFAQLAPEVRARHGLPPASSDQLHHAWPKSPRRPDPLEPLWVTLALVLGGVVTGWSVRSARPAPARPVSAQPPEIRNQ